MTNKAITLSAVLLASNATLVVVPAVAKSTKVQALPTPKNLNTLGDVDGDSDEYNITLTTRLSKKPSWPKVPEIKEHGSFLQVHLPDTIVPDPGRFFDGPKPWVPKIAVFQLTPSEAGVRFFVQEHADAFKKASEIMVLDKRLVIAIDRKKLEDLLAEAKKKKKMEAEFDHPDEPNVAIPIPHPPAEEVLAQTKVDYAIKAPAALLKTEPPLRPLDDGSNPVREQAKEGSAAAHFANKEAASDAPPHNLPRSAQTTSEPAAAEKGGDLANPLVDKLKEATSFFALLFVGLFIALGLKPWLARRRSLAQVGDADMVSMKMLSTLPLAAKQKLSLVQVGNERILLGVTPDSINLLASLGAGSGVQRSGMKAEAGLEHKTSLLAAAKLPAQKPGLLTQGAPDRLAAATKAPAFNRVLRAEAQGELAARPTPKLKNIEGNDEATLKAKASAKIPTQHDGKNTSATDRRAASSASGTRSPRAEKLMISIDEDGIKNMKLPGKTEHASQAAKNSADDVTKLIRDKLRALKSL